jgi:ATP phosphoribosyltransferase
MTLKNSLVIAVPKGRILSEVKDLFNALEIEAESDFFAEDNRKIIFTTNKEKIKLLKVRSFDVANFVKFGGADLGICGSDVLAEFPSSEIFVLLNLKIGKCKMILAGKENNLDKVNNASCITIATKYPNITSEYFSNKGIRAEIVKLNGAVEIAVTLNLSEYIVDISSTGKSLIANNLNQLTVLNNVNSLLIANRHSFKVKNQEVVDIVNKLRVKFND